MAHVATIKLIGTTTIASLVEIPLISPQNTAQDQDSTIPSISISMQLSPTNNFVPSLLLSNTMSLAPKIDEISETCNISVEY